MDQQHSGAVGYGPNMAFPPVRLNISLPSELTYVSNGNARIPIAAVAFDPQGFVATSGKTPLNSM